MTNVAFEKLVKEKEIEAKENRASYKRKVAAFSLIGYGYLLLMFGLILGLFSFAIVNFVSGSFTFGGMKFGLITLVLGIIMTRALWVRFEHPEGVTLSEDDAPDLFVTIRDIQHKYKTKTVHEVLLTNQYNASIVQHPRLGVFGWYKNYLVLGLPLMQAMSRDHLDAIIAHEMGHLANKHGQFGTWLYRVRETWINLLEKFEESEVWGGFLFRWFFRWFVPRFDAYSHALAKQEEHAADCFSSHYTEPHVVAEALVVTEIKAYLYDEFWDRLYDEGLEEKECPRPFRRVQQVLDYHDPVRNEKSWNKAIKRVASVHDTHPSLTERLQALTVEMNEVPSIVVTYPAADFYLEDKDHFIEFFDDVFVRVEKEDWKERKYEKQQMKLELEELGANSTLSLEDAIKRTTLFEDVYGPKKALPVYEQLLTTYPEAKLNVTVLMGIGNAYFESEDEKGFEPLEEAMKRDYRVGLDALSLMANYYESKGLHEQILTLDERAAEWSDLVEKADQERNEVVAGDHYVLPVLKTEIARMISQYLRLFPQVRVAHLFEKVVTHFPDQKVYVLTVELEESYVNNKKRNEFMERVCDELEADEEIIVQVTNGNRMMKKAIQTLPESVIYEKGKKFIEPEIPSVG
ncbi:M48 family metallopeptidase [Guptibacillus algicola]|uniref:M48 family metallopeptidase n=1 Tax=Guptibacillus algicola TaxID=225844 RepID=UPI001CD72F59|nr:M48 family metallopeptidase [Alkalihalobacillus algicola]MCA0987141.1 M48 family metallopeptidase [Alkalihalobacillus algicola]